MGHRGAVAGRVLEVGLPALVVVVGILWLTTGATGYEPASSDRERAQRRPLLTPLPSTRLDPDDAVVAIIDGVAIRQGWLDIVAEMPAAQALFGPAYGVMTERALLDRMVEREILAKVAERAGVTVTEDEVTRAIQGRFVVPFENTDHEVTSKLFELLGVTRYTVASHAELRNACRNALLVERYLEDSDVPEAEILAVARPEAAVNVFLRDQVSYR